MTYLHVLRYFHHLLDSTPKVAPIFSNICYELKNSKIFYFLLNYQYSIMYLKYFCRFLFLHEIFHSEFPLLYIILTAVYVVCPSLSASF